MNTVIKHSNFILKEMILPFAALFLHSCLWFCFLATETEVPAICSVILVHCRMPAKNWEESGIVFLEQARVRHRLPCPPPAPAWLCLVLTEWELMKASTWVQLPARAGASPEAMA